MKIVHVNCSDKELRKDIQGLIDLIGGIVDKPDALDFMVAVEPLSLLKTLKGLKGKEVSIPKMSIRWEDDKLWLKK